jgi:hypothetical protein
LIEQSKETYRHALAVTTTRPGMDGSPYLYTLNMSCRQEMWADLEPLFKQCINSFRLLETTNSYIPPDKDPWLFFWFFIMTLSIFFGLEPKPNWEKKWNSTKFCAQTKLNSRLYSQHFHKTSSLACDTPLIERPTLFLATSSNGQNLVYITPILAGGGIDLHLDCMNASDESSCFNLESGLLEHGYKQLSTGRCEIFQGPSSTLMLLSNVSPWTEW